MTSFASVLQQRLAERLSGKASLQAGIRTVLERTQLALERLSTARVMNETELELARSFFEAYNGCFLRRDLDALRRLHVDRGPFVYFDNHSGCDSPSLEDHFAKVGRFLATGDIVGLETEILACSVHGEAAAVVGRVRYRRDNPGSAVRVSAFLERHGGTWKVRHLHWSGDPNDTGA